MWAWGGPRRQWERGSHSSCSSHCLTPLIPRRLLKPWEGCETLWSQRADLYCQERARSVKGLLGDWDPNIHLPHHPLVVFVVIYQVFTNLKLKPKELNLLSWSWYLCTYGQCPIHHPMGQIMSYGVSDQSDQLLGCLPSPLMLPHLNCCNRCMICCLQEPPFWKVLSIELKYWTWESSLSYKGREQSPATVYCPGPTHEPSTAVAC